MHRSFLRGTNQPPRRFRPAVQFAVVAGGLASCGSAPVEPADLPEAQAADRARGHALTNLREELIERGRRDQEVRSQDFESMTPDARARAFASFRQVDLDNTGWLKQVVARHGWPTVAMVGREAASAAFLLVQHADADLDFQARMLPVLQEAAQRGEALPRHVALLADRVRVKQSRPQLYGSQYHVRQAADGSARAGPEGALVYLLPVVEDVARLDQRRRAAGLEPWHEYEQRMAAMQNRQPAPRAWNGELPVDPQTHP